MKNDAGRARVLASHRRRLPNGETEILGIVGDPIRHSLSPSLHGAVLRALDRNLVYLPFPVSLDRLRDFVALAPSLGIRGLNVTTPYKEEVARWTVSGDEEAERTGSVNTVNFSADGALGVSTDGAGVLHFLEDIGMAGRTIGVLGFGPTARSVLFQAASRGLTSVVLSRRPAVARSVLAEWGRPGAFSVIESAAEPAESAVVWISTLPPSVLPRPEFWRAVSRRAVFVDMNYGQGRTGAADAAREAGFRACDGLGPLCAQAALSLSLWLGEAVPVSLFHQALGPQARSLRPRR